MSTRTDRNVQLEAGNLLLHVDADVRFVVLVRRFEELDSLAGDRLLDESKTVLDEHGAAVEVKDERRHLGVV